MLKQDLEIYIHIPFCVKKCEYCDFLSFQQYNDTYVQALIREIETARLGGNEAKDYNVKTIFIGGGTPSILTGKDMRLILESVFRRFNVDKNAEITIETNPGTLSEEKLKAYKQMGINRISMGLQSTNNKELKELGRIHTYEEFLKNYDLTRKIGFTNINIDLMSAIPGQTIESWKKTLDKITVLNPEHISSYSLIIEEGTKFYDKYNKNLLSLPTEEEERQMYYDTKSILEKAGYQRYEISNYCKKGYECKHNIGYWRRTNYIGFGLGAASLVSDYRFNNTKDMKQYVKLVNRDEIQLRVEVHKLSQQEAMEETMFLGLRMMRGVSIQEFEQIFHVNFQNIYGECSDKLIKQGLLERKEDKICLTIKGIDLSNFVMAEFLLS